MTSFKPALPRLALAPMRLETRRRPHPGVTAHIRILARGLVLMAALALPALGSQIADHRARPAQAETRLAAALPSPAVVTAAADMRVR